MTDKHLVFWRRFVPLLFIALVSSCSSKKISDISYLDSSVSIVESFPELNVFHPKKSTKSPVVIFIHGGYWEQGNKEIYNFLGRNFAKKDIVTVIPNYTLSPDGNYDSMAKEVADAIQWTHDNIDKYNGNPDQIFLMGHSAGGHLIALVGTNPKYLAQENKDLVKGIILNDAAGLDQYSYLVKNPPTKNHHYDITWTQDSKNWKDASPIYFLSERTPPILIYTGTKTFPSITSQNMDFIKELNKYQPLVEINYLTKKHVAMMRQFFLPWNRRYGEITDFLNNNK